MPELPEVETIRMGLAQALAGHIVENVDLRLKKIVLEGNLEDLVGSEVTGVRRFGKVLVIDFSNNLSILVHVKLTGQFVYLGPNRPSGVNFSSKLVGGNLPGKHTHVIFRLDKNGRLYYNDIRQFGWLRVILTEKVEEFKFISELGPEPLALEGAKSADFLTLEKFKNIVSKSKTKIKVLLMNQTKIGGVGNIYANDALFLAGVDPRRPANSISQSEQSRLYDAVLEVLSRGLKHGGATELNFVNAFGEPGGYQKYFLVYSQEGESCPGKCGGKIEKIWLGGRGTYFCSVCQR